jgi:hypothetical protein
MAVTVATTTMTQQSNPFDDLFLLVQSANANIPFIRGG